ncbi:MAG: sulfite exporter TauE/SafE family protein [Nitrososphaeraceae archaeon]
MRKKQEMFALDPTLLLFFLIAFISEVIGAIAGFGSSTIFLPLALFFLDFKTALILVAISHLIGNIGRINFFRHGLDKKMIITFGIPSILLSFLGASLVGILPQSILQIILGIFLIAFSVLFLLKPSLKFATNTRTTITGGGISGFITGIVGTGGALATDSTRIPLYLYQGFLLPQYYYYIPIFFVTAIGGSFLGRKIVGRINQTTFKKIVLLSIILVSIKFIIDGSSSILK